MDDVRRATDHSVLNGENREPAEMVDEQQRRREATLDAAIRFAETTAKVNSNPAIRAQAAARVAELRSLRDEAKQGTTLKGN